MRSRFSLFAAALLLALPIGVAAQDCDCDYDDDYYHDRRPTGGYAGANLTIARTQGEFSDYVDGGVGGSAHYIHRFDRHGLLALRVDGGFVVYGYERFRVPLSPTLGGRILVDLSTSNNIAWIGVGPQIGVPAGWLQPYANAYAGYTYLSTTSSVSGTYYDEQIATTTNFDDWSFSYGGGGGLYVPLRSGRRPISLDLGVRYHNNGVAEYLREGDIQDNQDGTITVFPVRSDTDLLTFHIGLSFGLVR